MILIFLSTDSLLREKNLKTKKKPPKSRQQCITSCGILSYLLLSPPLLFFAWLAVGVSPPVSPSHGTVQGNTFSVLPQSAPVRRPTFLPSPQLPFLALHSSKTQGLQSLPERKKSNKMFSEFQIKTWHLERSDEQEIGLIFNGIIKRIEFASLILGTSI